MGQNGIQKKNLNYQWTVKTTFRQQVLLHNSDFFGEEFSVFVGSYYRLNATSISFECDPEVTNMHKRVPSMTCM